MALYSFLMQIFLQRIQRNYHGIDPKYCQIHFAAKSICGPRSTKLEWSDDHHSGFGIVSWARVTEFGLDYCIPKYWRGVGVASRIWRWKVQSRLWKSRKWQASSHFDHWSFIWGRCDQRNLLFGQSIGSGPEVK